MFAECLPLYDTQSLREFVGIDLSRELVPDATTLLKFRRLLLDNHLAWPICSSPRARCWMVTPEVRLEWVSGLERG